MTGNGRPLTAVEPPLVEVADLRVDAGGRPVLDGVSFTLATGGSVGVVGASGSGKTTMALAVLGHVREGMRLAGGAVRVRGTDVVPDPPAWLRGNTVGYLPQDPGQALNPYRRVGAALLDALGAPVPRTARGALVAGLLRRVGLPADPAFTRRFPHQLSGGQQQRVGLAVALCREPALLVLDEPTTGLDVVTKAEVLAELVRVHAGGVALLWVSHDLGTLADRVDRLLVLDRGRLVEDGPARQVLRAARSAPARELIGAVPPPPAARPAGGTAAAYRTAVPGPEPSEVDGVGAAARYVLAARNLTAAHDRGPLVIKGVDLDVQWGECVAVLGASGVGKTTLARCLAGLHRPASGALTAAGEPVSLDVRRRTTAQRARIQLVAQDPAETLHPRQTVWTALARPLRLLRGLRDRARIDAEVAALLTAVRLPPQFAGRLPGELSGGERQRVALARALAARPAVLLCDEVTSALDLVTQAAVLALLAEVRRQFGLAVVLVTHDLAVAAGVADRLLILADGRVVEEGTPDAVLNWPESAVGRRIRDAFRRTGTVAQETGAMLGSGPQVRSAAGPEN
jgi:peptide/nickel transport system ATP-binding protein